jgi:twitching motility two-component system response regulator PilH
MKSLRVATGLGRVGISIRTSVAPMEGRGRSVFMASPRSESQSQNLPLSAPAVELRSGLIVTASTATQRMYAEYLAWRGVSVHEVTNATAALDHLSRFTPDVIVIEDKLEDGRGVDLVLTLRRSRQTSRIPIALLSADVFGMTPVRAHRFGCDLLIPIPCLPDALFDALVQLVGDGVTHRESKVLDSWLFTRGGESVRIVRQRDFELSVYGPSWKRGVYQFGSELELSTYQADYERELVRTGFTFEAFGGDRRRRPRPTPRIQRPEAGSGGSKRGRRRSSTARTLSTIRDSEADDRTCVIDDRGQQSTSAPSHC